MEPIDQARAGRLVLAVLDGDKPRADAIITEAANDTRGLELLDAVLAGLIAIGRLTIGLDNTRQFFADWILHAHNKTEQQAEHR